MPKPARVQVKSLGLAGEWRYLHRIDQFGQPSQTGYAEQALRGQAWVNTATKLNVEFNLNFAYRLQT